MKKLQIQIDYTTHWGQTMHIVGAIPEIGSWENDKSRALEYIGGSIWQIDLEIPKSYGMLAFSFLVKENGNIIAKEYGDAHCINLGENDTQVKCIWNEKPKQPYFHTSLFTNSVFHQSNKELQKTNEDDIQLIVNCVHTTPNQELVICGGCPYLGAWQTDKAPTFLPISYGKWYINMPKDELCSTVTYKLAIRNRETKEIVEWEEGDNRLLSRDSLFQIHELSYKKEWINWKGSGVAIPIFSLRSENSSGIGEFSDLKLMIDWAAASKMNIIQVLPINDTTATNSWFDSYPYNAISIYALHPIYLGLHKFPLKDESKRADYLEQFSRLNELSTIDYTKVIELKTKYINDLFYEIGQSTLDSEKFTLFIEMNKNWLFPYACFCHLRDRFSTTRLTAWGEFTQYNEEKLRIYISSNEAIATDINKVYYTQYLLHKQLTEAKEYAYTKGVALKGDIPIGISPNSVEAWTEPHLFNLDTQTGAPPDDFAVNGQNWGFPTYNWEEMKKDGYKWWTKRFTKMADYFDAYRIDHILGFFRIWEIPTSAIHGLLGYFSPALPLSIEELTKYGIVFENQMTIPRIHKEDLLNLFQDKTEDVIAKYLFSIDGYWFGLQEEYNTQRKIEAYFHDKNTQIDISIRDGLYAICNEVLFIQDKHDEDKYHPRIALYNTLRFAHLLQEEQAALNKTHEEFFYHRHSQFWKDEAMRKLPTLIESTNMLVCGEDLGMVPASVPSVMADLQILSLEIQRMPKQLGVQFSDLSQLPYLSVATTSTHDMPPLRKWWTEDAVRTQFFFYNTLGLNGKAPKSCNTAISLQIIKDHLNSPAMLTILPLQDWLSLSDKLRRKNADEEQINIPAIAHHNWNYRMHLTLEDLIEENEFSDLVAYLNEESGR